MQTLRGKLLAIHRRRRHLRLGRRWYTRIGTTAPEDAIGWRAARPATRSLQVMDKSFEELIAEAGAVDVAGWDFSWLDGRAAEERPPWGYQKLMGEKLGRAALTLDIQTGGGEALAGVPQRAGKVCRSTIAVVDRGVAADDRTHSHGGRRRLPELAARRGQGQASTTPS